MSKLKLNITMSLDGFVAGPDQSAANPIGIRGQELHGWLLPLKAFRERHGEEGGEVNASTPFAEDILAGAGLFRMRSSFPISCMPRNPNRTPPCRRPPRRTTPSGISSR